MTVKTLGLVSSGFAPSREFGVKVCKFKVETHVRYWASVDTGVDKDFSLLLGMGRSF